MDSTDSIPFKVENLPDCFDESLLPFLEGLSIEPRCSKCSIQFKRPSLNCKEITDHKIKILEIVFKHLCRSCAKETIKYENYVKLE
jgi:hypothetical protein